MKPTSALWPALLLAFSLPPSALAELVATVQPGKQFVTGEAPTVAKLNALGRPVITITGTIGGTNANLAQGSLDGTHMVDTFAGSNLTWDASSPRRLVVANEGIGTNQLSANVAGDGLSGGYGVGQLTVNVGSGLAVTNDFLTVTNVLPGALTVTSNYFVIGSSNNVAVEVPLPTGWSFDGTNFTTGFVSAEYTLAAGVIADTNHNLSAAPGLVRWVVVCQTNELGYVAGDQLPADAVRGASEDLKLLSGGNASNVFLLCRSLADLQVLNRTNPAGAFVEITPVNWKAKCYARP